MGRRKAINVDKYQRLVEAKDRKRKMKEIAEDIVPESLKPYLCAVSTKTVVYVAICQEPCGQNVNNMNMDPSIDDLDPEFLISNDLSGTVEDQQRNCLIV